jgi:hypothetical protein
MGSGGRGITCRRNQLTSSGHKWRKCRVVYSLFRKYFDSLHIGELTCDCINNRTEAK